MPKSQWIAFGVLAVVILTVALTMVVRSREGRCSFERNSRHVDGVRGKLRAFNCTYPIGSFEPARR